MMTTPHLVVVSALVVCACDDARNPPPSISPPKPTPVAERWLEEFPAYPGARYVCSQHVSGAGPNALHINWTLWATTDDPANVAAFYAGSGGVAPGPNGETLALSSADRLRHVSVHPVSGSYPSCQVKPPADARTVFIVSQGTRYGAPGPDPSSPPSPGGSK